MKSSIVLAGVLLATVAEARPRVLVRGPESCGTTRMPSPVVSQRARPASPANTIRTVYLNRYGGTYNIANAATDSATNTANVIAAGDGRPHANAVIPPLESSFDWPYIVECVKQQYQPYGVIVTESEPSSGDYVEAVVGGDGASTGWSASSGILGVASADHFCGVTERGIAFSFSSNHRGISRANDELCATVAHEVGHLLSLEHEIAPRDTMSYVPFASAGAKSFTSEPATCGTDAQNTTNCSCAPSGPGQVTSSAMRLATYVGLRPTETLPPSLTVTSPGDDSTLRPSFEVTATATDDTAMAEVAVLVDGMEVGASTTPDGDAYTIAARQVAEGPHTLEVQATDLAGNVTAKQIAINVARGQLGEVCVGNDDCSDQLCARDGSGATFCTRACGEEAACPSDFSCESAGAQSVCVPSSDGGCATGGGTPASLGLVLGALATLKRSGRRRARLAHR